MTSAPRRHVGIRLLYADAMADLYERGYRKIAAVEDLKNGEPRLYRTGGATILLLRSHIGVRAADATRCVDASELAAVRDRLASVGACLGSETGSSTDWSAAIERAPLPAETDDGAVWVCVDQCATSE